jgi:hypothetical protein
MTPGAPQRPKGRRVARRTAVTPSLRIRAGVGPGWGIRAGVASHDRSCVVGTRAFRLAQRWAAREADSLANKHRQTVSHSRFKSCLRSPVKGGGSSEPRNVHTVRESSRGYLSVMAAACRRAVGGCAGHHIE